MKLIFITTNKHKAAEVSRIMAPYGITVEQRDHDYEECHELGIEGIAARGARECADHFGEAVCVEDTGLFLEAYPGFPGPLPKFILKTLGLPGILKLLEGKDRGATFKTVVGYCEPGKEAVTFEGTMKGHIADGIDTSDPDPHGYNPIFIPEGYEKQLSTFSLEERNKVSQRGEAFRKLAEHLAD